MSAMGTPLSQRRWKGVTAEIVRRQPDGTWKYAIDNPWGGAVLAPARSRRFRY